MSVEGIIFSNIHDSNISELTRQRTLASVPFGCRYRLSVARGARRATRRALRPCLLNASSSLRGREARRDLQERAQTPAVQVWVSGA